MARNWRGFVVAPGAVQELAEDGAVIGRYDEPALYDDLVLAGYPLSAARDGCVIDLSLDPDFPSEVTVYTQGTRPHEWAMGPVSGLFLAWFEQRHV